MRAAHIASRQHVATFMQKPHAAQFHTKIDTLLTLRRPRRFSPYFEGTTSVLGKPMCAEADGSARASAGSSTSGNNMPGTSVLGAHSGTPSGPWSAAVWL
eukprot:3230674-Rhodomonas_salina.1